MKAPEQGELTDPVRKSQIAGLLGLAVSTVYDSLRQFDALRVRWELSDSQAERDAVLRQMGRHIPCIHFGGTPQANDTIKGGRYVVPREAFLCWYASCGLDAGVLEQMYGGDVGT
jgi:hypothetical protein